MIPDWDGIIIQRVNPALYDSYFRANMPAVLIPCTKCFKLHTPRASLSLISSWQVHSAVLCTVTVTPPQGAEQSQPSDMACDRQACD